MKLYAPNILLDLGQITPNSTLFQHDSVQIKENRCDKTKNQLKLEGKTGLQLYEAQAQNLLGQEDQIKHSGSAFTSVSNNHT